MIPRDAGCDRVHFGARLRERNASFEPSKSSEIKIATLIFFWIELQRHPHVGRLRKPPAFGHDTDNGGLLAVDGNDFSDDRPIAAKVSLPDVITDQCHRRGIELIFLWPKLPAENRLHPEK